MTTSFMVISSRDITAQVKMQPGGTVGGPSHAVYLSPSQATCVLKDSSEMRYKDESGSYDPLRHVTCGRKGECRFDNAKVVDPRILQFSDLEKN